MNASQLNARRAELAAEQSAIDAALTASIANKAYNGLGDLEARIERLKADQDELAFAEVRAKAAGVHPLGRFDGIAAASLSEEQQEVPADDRRLSFGAKSANKMAAGLVARKSLAASGAAVISQEFQPDPIALGKPALGLLDVLPSKSHATELYAYLRQNVRTNNAAVVAEGATKPTSVYGVVRVEQSLSVVAHLSEGIPHYWLSDNPTLTGFISNELTYGLQVAVEQKVLADINATSGILTQAFATTIPTTP